MTNLMEDGWRELTGEQSERPCVESVEFLSRQMVARCFAACYAREPLAKNDDGCPDVLVVLHFPQTLAGAHLKRIAQAQ